MTTFTFTSPEGKSWDVTVPDAATKEQAWCLLQGSMKLPKGFVLNPQSCGLPQESSFTVHAASPQDWGAIPTWASDPIVAPYNWIHDPTLWGYMFVIVVCAALLGLYFSPLIIARRRRHRQTLAIGMLNLSLGVVALVGGAYEIKTVIVLAVFVWLGLLTWACIRWTPKQHTFDELQSVYEKKGTNRRS
jgi:hypothetical protein